MSMILLIASLLAVVNAQQLTDDYSAKKNVRSLNTMDKNIDVNCFSDLNNVIYNLVPRTDIPTMELHVACSTKSDNVYRVVGARPNISLHCLENITTIASWLGEFSKNVKSLDASNNCVKHLSVIPELPMLKILNLKHNSIEDIEHGAFGQLHQLEILDLSFNLLTEDQLVKETFQSQCTKVYMSDDVDELKTIDSEKPCFPRQLVVLNLGHNNIHSLHPNMFKYFTNLRELHLNNNPLSVVDANTITAIQSIPQLKVLHLSNLHMSTLPYNLFEGLQLQALYLNGNNFTSVPEELSLLWRTLLYLNINDNPIQTLNYDSFIGLNRLREIEAAGLIQLQTVNEGTFSHLGSLETVILSYNPQLSYIDPQAFTWSTKSPSSLTRVYLQGNRLTHISEKLLPWSQMEVVQLSGNFWACDCELRWYLELTEKRRINALKDSGLRCSTPKWPNVTGVDIYNRPIRKFACAQTSDSYLQYKEDVYRERLVVLVGLASIMTVAGLILVRCAYRISRRKQSPNALNTLSGTVTNHIPYTKLHKSVYNM